MQRVALAGFTGFLLAFLCLAGVATAETKDGEACRVQSGQLAIDACNRVINSGTSKRQEVIDAYINRGQEYYTQKDYDRALADFSVAIGMSPREAIAFGNRANCWYVKKEYQRALADYTQAISIERNYTAAYAGRGMTHEALGDKDKARADYRSSLSVPQKFQDGKWAHEKSRERLQALGN